MKISASHDKAVEFQWPMFTPNKSRCFYDLQEVPADDVLVKGKLLATSIFPFHDTFSVIKENPII